MWKVALDEPNDDCKLFVPKASVGDNPILNSTGTVISPPPPAMESTKPAQTPVRNSAG